MSDFHIIVIQTLIRRFLARCRVKELKLFEDIKEQYITMLKEHARDIINKFLRYCINQRRMIFNTIKFQYLEMKEEHYRNVIRKFLRFCIKKRSSMKSNIMSTECITPSRRDITDLIDTNNIENMFSTIEIKHF